MKKYDYENAICYDVLDYICSNGIKQDIFDAYAQGENALEDLKDRLDDDLFVSEVTGNDSDEGYKHEGEVYVSEYLCGNFGLLKEAFDCFGEPTKFSAVAFDTTIRCYLLRGCIDKVVLKIIEDKVEEICHQWFWEEI